MLIKICGMRRQEDISYANELNFDFCGFIFHSQSPRHIEPEEAKKLDTGSMKRVGVFVKHSAEEIIQIMETANLNYAQLHGSQTIEDAHQIGSDRVIRVIWPERYKNAHDLQRECKRHADSCAYFLFDAGLAGGGSGKHINIPFLSDIQLPHPWFLAGGLQPDTLGQHITEYSPYGLDVNSGVEISPGIKDHTKMRKLKISLKMGREQ